MIVIEKWSGLVTAASPYALPGGAMVHQVNMQCTRPGQMQCRNGYSSFVSATDAPNAVVAIARYSAGTQDQLVALVGNSLAIVSI